ncbi:spore germination protein [Neobacillus sp. OS1-2]|uniref:spore germination protein n=1 Tax=Neobacillus sp. OS1-2 TaxID=3070680 RepID=UPI0027DFBEB7|nr:spore germination protein [Neobacillus sp. OS1-2]WML39830.1 spore germination protein [Neobacillus sp. OS1-2]
MAINRDGVTIGTISGGIVNFGGAVYISPISITRTTTGAGEENKGAGTATNSTTQTSISSILDVISRSLR